MGIKHLFFHLSLIFSLLHFKAESQHIFQTLSTENGLSDDFVSAIVQDKHGYIWISTQMGLNRFDGENNKRINQQNYPSLIRDDFNCLLSDPNGNLFCGSYDGVISKYQFKKDSFIDISINSFQGKEYPSFFSLKHNKKYGILALSSSGIYQFDKESNSFKRDFLSQDSIHNKKINDVFNDLYGRVWIGTDSGLYVSISEKNMIKTIPVPYQNLKIITLCSINDSTLLIGTENNGLWNINTAHESIPSPQKITTPFHGIISLLYDSEKTLWVGTSYEGLWNTTELNNYLQIPFTKENIPAKTITTIVEDKNSTIWVGTHGNGAYYTQKKHEGTLQHSSEFNIPESIVTDFEEDANGNIWLSTDGNGIYILNSNHKLIKHLTNSDNLPSNAVLSMSRQDSLIWFASWSGGLSSINTNTFGIKTWDTKNSDIPTNNCKTICATKQGTVYYGSHGKGLAVFDAEKNQVKAISDKNNPNFNTEFNPWIQYILEGQSNIIWVASLRNIWKMKNGKFILCLNDSTGTIHLPLYIHTLSKSNSLIYAGTNKGIFTINPHSNNHTHLNKTGSEESIALVFDTNQNLWTASYNSIKKITHTDDKIYEIALPEICKKGRFFTPRASFISNKGYVYFGGTNGFISFHPDSLQSQSSKPQIIFSDLHIASKPVKAGSKLLKNNIAITDTIQLSYLQTNIQLHFSLLSSQTGVQCKYKLEGLDSDWQNIGTKRDISFSHIPPGKYTLLLTTVNNNNKLNHPFKSLHIFISPPWWESWWFRVAILLFITFAVISIFYFRMKQIVKQNHLLELTVKKRTHSLLLAKDNAIAQNQELSEKQFVIEMRNEELQRTLTAKDKLLSIIAHDLKNPMFAIVGLTHSLYSRFDIYTEQKKKNLLKSVYDSSQKLQDEMLRLLDWAATDQHNIAYAPQNADISLIARDCISFLQQSIENKKINIDIQTQTASFAFIDPRMIATVIRNIIANAIKFTPENGMIYLKVEKKSEIIQLTITDTGIGMSEEQIKSITEQHKATSTLGTNNEAGTGLGLKICFEFVRINKGIINLNSAPNKGSCFTISLPSENTEVKASKMAEIQINEPDEAQLTVAPPAGISVLVIDDNPMIREHLGSVLGEGVELFVAENGLTGLDSAKQNQPDIIICDIDMPEMDGYEFCQTASQHAELAHIPIILLTAKSGEAEKFKGLSSGAIDYLTKPFNENELIIKLKNIIAIRSNQQQYYLNKKFSGEKLHSNTNPFIKRVIESIEGNFQRPDFSIDELASNMSVSQATLNRKLSSIVNKTASELLNEHRMHEAMKLLKQHELSVSEVAYSVGYNDPKYFGRRFKQFFGESPSQVK